MPYDEIQPGGLSSLLADEQVDFSKAIDASDCYLDDGTWKGRNGYRSVTGNVVGSGLVQGLWRFRPLSTAARTIMIQGGHVYVITDPSTELLSDGVATDLGLTFGTTDAVSGVQVGKYLYLAANGSANWWRVNSSFALEQYKDIPIGATPAVAQGALTFTKFAIGASLVAAGGTPPTIGASGITDWINVGGGVVGGTATWDMGSNQDWSGMGWLFVACSPNTVSNGGGTFSISIADNSGNVNTLDTIYDGPGDGGPDCIFLSLAGVPASIRSAARKIIFTQISTVNTFDISGFMPIPTAPVFGPVDYFVTFKLAATGQRSLPNPAPDSKGNHSIVTYKQLTTFPTFHAARWYYSSFIEAGTAVSINPDVMDATQVFNLSVGKAMPKTSQLTGVATFSGNGPAAGAGAYDTAELWRGTGKDYRLAKTQTIAVGGAYSLTDDQGDLVLANSVYYAGGSPPPVNTMGARGGRFVTGGDSANPNRIAISNFLAFTSTTDSFPVFPGVALLPSDGASFDIAPTAAEQVLWIGNGDAIYELTNESCNVQSDLTPNGIPYLIFQRGCMGRAAALWAENALFYAAHDSIYMVRNRSYVEELATDIRRTYKTWLVPDSTTVMSYQDRKLYIFRGTKFLRYDFVLKVWTRGTIADSVAYAINWRDPSGTIQNLWFATSTGNLMRWQASATSDAGTAIPAWTYSTGYAVTQGRTRPGSIYADVSGDGLTINLDKNASGIGPVSRYFNAGVEGEKPFDPQQTAYKWRVGFVANSSLTVLTRCMWELADVEGKVRVA